MTMVKNFGLGGVASTVQLGKNGASIASEDADGVSVINALNTDGDLTNVRAADPVENTDVVTKQWAKGNNITLGMAEDGSLTEGGAIQLQPSDSVTSAVDSLNEILGKLIPAAPKSFPGGETISVVGTSSGLLASGGVPDNTAGGTLPAAAGQAVQRTSATTVSSTVVGAGDNVGPGDSGFVQAFVNNVKVDEQQLSLGADNKSTGILRVANDQAYPVATPGFWESFRTNISGATAIQGWNRMAIKHTAAGATPDAYFVVEPSNTPTVTAASLQANTNGTLAPSSGIPHFGTGGKVNAVFTASNLSLETYKSAGVLTVSGSALSATASYAAGQAGLPSVLSRNMAPHDANIALDITGTSSSASQLTINAANMNGTGSATPAEKILVNKGSAGGKVDEMGIPVTIAVNGGPSATVATRVVMAGGDTPADNKSALTTGDWNSASATQTYDAAVVGGVLANDRVNYSTGYLPAGPDRSGHDAVQYITFMFRRTAVSKFDISVTGSYTSMQVKLPGLTEANTSATNGWLSMSTLYGGAGYAGDTNGGNGSLGCALGAVASGSGSWTCTFGTLSSTNAANNIVLVRFKLAAGQSISALSFVPATR